MFTLIWLSTFGYSYFKGHFADRGRYKSLVCPFLAFFQMIVLKVKDLDLSQVVDKLLENKEQLIEYLREANWSADGMTTGTWV